MCAPLKSTSVMSFAGFDRLNGSVTSSVQGAEVDGGDFFTETVHIQVVLIHMYMYHNGPLMNHNGVV